MLRQMSLLEMGGWDIDSSGLNNFLYDPNNKKAYFTDTPDVEHYMYIGTSDSIKLWILKDRERIKWDPIVAKKRCSLPLIKSHLQKAIRRRHSKAALEGLLVMLTLDPLQTLRRLGVIAIEDVCLTKGFSIVTWLMMAHKYHSLTNQDVKFLCNYVQSLVYQESFYQSRRDIPKVTRQEITMLSETVRDEILALYHRARYGGMKCDQNMLREATNFYAGSPVSVKRMITGIPTSIPINKINQKIQVLAQAIDFHPFPQIIPKIVKDTDVTAQKVKRLIWEIDSGVNLRKQHTMTKRNVALQDDNWQTVSLSLASCRMALADIWLE
jgi:hypothetical protein